MAMCMASRLVAMAAFLAATGTPSASGEWKDADVARCRKGKASACEALGFSKPLAGRLVGFLRLTAPNTRAERLAAMSPEDELVAAIALVHPEPATRVQAAHLLVNADALRRVARGDSSPEVRLAAAANPALLDQAVLWYLALNDPVPSVRYGAILRIEDVDSMASMLLDHTDGRVRVVTAKRLTNQALIAETAMTHPDPLVRLAASTNPHLNDPDILSRLYLQSPDPTVRDVIAARTLFPSFPDDSALGVGAPNDPRRVPAGITSYGSGPSGAGSSVGDGTVHVKGYTRKDGTYVRPHTRSKARGRK